MGLHSSDLSSLTFLSETGVRIQTETDYITKDATLKFQRQLDLAEKWTKI
jgi:hypothetical protein